MLPPWCEAQSSRQYIRKQPFAGLLTSFACLTLFLPICNCRLDFSGDPGRTLRPCGGKQLLTKSATSTLDSPLLDDFIPQAGLNSASPPQSERRTVFRMFPSHATGGSAGKELGREAAIPQASDVPWRALASPQEGDSSAAAVGDDTLAADVHIADTKPAGSEAAAGSVWYANGAGTALRNPGSAGAGIEFKVIYGEDAPRGRFPYMCTLRDPYTGAEYCAGTLIHPEIVLTAGHCLSPDRLPFDPDLSPIVVICGDYRPSEDNGTDILRSRQLAINPEWKSREADIGLLWLARPALNTPTVAVATPEEWDRINVEGQELWGVGFGRLNMQESGERRRFPLVLQEFQSPILSTDTCNELYGGEVNPRTMMCVGDDDGGPATCKGDSGGPMVYVPEDVDSPSTHIQVAIISWSGDSCGTAEEPDVNTKVSAFYDWIQQGIREVEGVSKAAHTP